MKRWLFAVVLSGFVLAASWWLWLQSAPLSALRQGGSGPPTVVLLHGYGSRAEDWLQFNGQWRFPPGTRIVYPQAPWRGFPAHHGWWWLHLESYVKPGGQLPDMADASPGGLKAAALSVRNLLAHERPPIVLGGFSQGAMVGAEVAFQTDQELDALVLIGGTPVNEAAWAEHFAGRRRLPIFIAHGRQDRVLPFAAMERFQQRLKDFGLDVTWYPYDGGHDIPPEVIGQISRFVTGVFQHDQAF